MGRESEALPSQSVGTFMGQERSIFSNPCHNAVQDDCLIACTVSQSSSRRGFLPPRRVASPAFQGAKSSYESCASSSLRTVSYDGPVRVAGEYVTTDPYQIGLKRRRLGCRIGPVGCS